MTQSGDRTFKTDGIVLKITKTGESDRLIYVLTRDKGVVRAFAKSAERPKNKLHSSTNIFCYSHFTFYEGSSAVKVTECEIIEQFYSLRLDLKRLSLAQYLNELALEGIQENVESEEILRLHLNTLHFLCDENRDERILKSVYELRFACLLGLMPQLIACNKCNTYETETMNFDCLTGQLLCENCSTNKKNDIPLDVVTAMRQISFPDMKYIFSVKLNEADIKILNRVTQEYILSHLERKFKTLDFYNAV